MAELIKKSFSDEFRSNEDEDDDLGGSKELKTDDDLEDDEDIVKENDFGNGGDLNEEN